MNVVNRIAMASLALAACVDGASKPDDRDPKDQLTEVSVTPPEEPVAIATDFCDDSTFAGASWNTLTTPHFTLQYLPNTPAEADIGTISKRLESAYSDIRGKLGITAEPSMTVNLSPNRNAATAAGLAFGRGWPSIGRYDVIYSGTPDSFEVARYGTMLTWMLDYYVDPANRNRLALFSTGIAEYLDQSGRDLHRAYIEQLDAGMESRIRIADFDARDVSGLNAGRAGSLVKFLIDRYGVENFARIYRATNVSWNGSCYANPTYGCISTPAQLTAMLDGVLTANTGDGWSIVQPLWQAQIESTMDRMDVGMPAGPTAEIENVVRLMDKAIATKDADMYRSTLEGFYCDYGGESLREQVADRAVNAFTETTTKIIGLYPTGIKNFATAQALVMRTDKNGMPTFSTLYFEHLPVGWRVTWGPDWF